MNNATSKTLIKWAGDGIAPTAGTSTIDIEAINLLFYNSTWSAFGTYNSYS